jgi:hypothetical protein
METPLRGSLVSGLSADLFGKDFHGKSAFGEENATGQARNACADNGH